MKGKAMTRQDGNRKEKIASSLHVPVRTALFGGAAVLILFAWLYLILALQIASTGRQIQMATEELNRLKRDNMALVHDIAVAESEEKMAARAAALGYGPQTPVYLPLDQAFAAAGPAVDGSNLRGDTGLTASNGQHRALSQFLLDSAWYDTATARKGASGSEIGAAKREP